MTVSQKTFYLLVREIGLSAKPKSDLVKKKEAGRENSLRKTFQLNRADGSGGF